MDLIAVLAILSRWLHIISAALVIGGVFFMRVILPAGTSTLDATTARDVFLKCRRIFKMVVHTCILLLLLSGAYNSIRNWPQYDSPLMHALWGMHVLPGLLVFGIALWLLAGAVPPASYRTWILASLILLLALVAVASMLKWARETRGKTPKNSPTVTRMVENGLGSPIAAIL